MQRQQTWPARSTVDILSPLQADDPMANHGYDDVDPLSIS
ncbi:hypothetical protein CISG_09516 [Coccidioides immitis RMSCC 3703]|uniref:Uncharacterized protein n=1 Tax=Coccidioides immitis RMSCC 3703 TaxID=454286 RepID=A0A0J8QJF0_COCIT|nr:hypothetical protein CISG_09516 [Coccidioides immitis RMSCC 3703]